MKISLVPLPLSLCILSLFASAAQALMFEGVGGMKPPQPSYLFSNPTRDRPRGGRGSAAH